MSSADISHLSKNFSMPFKKQLKEDFAPFDDMLIEDQNTHITLKHTSFLSHTNDKLLSPWIQSQFVDEAETSQLQKRKAKQRIFQNIKNASKLKHLDKVKGNVAELSKLSNTLLSFRNTISESKKKNILKDNLVLQEIESNSKSIKNKNSLKVGAPINRNLSLPIEEVRAKSPRIIFFERKIKLKQQLSHRQMMAFNFKNQGFSPQKYPSKYHTIVINRRQTFKKMSRNNNLLCFGATIQSWNKKMSLSLMQENFAEKQYQNPYF